ncbi:MAG: HAD-IIIC family phosphatase [Nitrospirota bacterium]
MKLIDALEVLKRPVLDAAPDLRVFLSCGFTPLHLQTFIAAQLRMQRPGHRVEVSTGLFGDLIGNIERLNLAGLESLAVVIEWADLDSRLAIRNLGGWRAADLPDIVKSSDQAATRLQEVLLRVSQLIPTVVCLPTLPLPPMFSTRPDQSAFFEIQLRHKVASLALALSEQAGIRIANMQYLDEMSSPNTRFDVKSEMITGFPYSLPHSAMLGRVMARLIHNDPPKKGLITDLDDTLWGGILGEDGINGITWDLEHRTHMHGLYQQFVASLASAGVLVGVASKNESAMVEQAFNRSDLHITKQDIFPLEINWGRKSESVKRILETWNISPDAVVFIDDSPTEAAEVKARFPELESIVFPKSDYQGVWNLLVYLRGIFGKPFLTEDDSIRLSSIRNATAWRNDTRSSTSASDEFLKDAESSIVFNCVRKSKDTRAFELVNKTNQFNLNGKRFSESEWSSYFCDPAAFLLTASYQDKYGSLGKVAVVMGKSGSHKLSVKAWVMSCRAFSRRIEHQCLNYIFVTFGADEIIFDYEETPRNRPLQDFFSELFGGPPRQGISLSREVFERNSPRLFHSVTGEANV